MPPYPTVDAGDFARRLRSAIFTGRVQLGPASQEWSMTALSDTPPTSDFQVVMPGVGTFRITVQYFRENA
jgi:hypothetical protein